MGPLYTSSTQKIDGSTIKVSMKTFKHLGSAKAFLKTLNHRFYQRFGRPISHRINLRGNKIEYYDKGKKAA